MATLNEKLKTLLPDYRAKVRGLIKEHGDHVVSNVTVTQLYGGMRGVKGLICDTSVVDPEKGVILRGHPIMDLTDKLPEEIFYLLLTGELPDAEALKSLQGEIADRSKTPEYVFDVLRAMPKDAHPMAMFNTAMLALQGESSFAKKYDEGMSKTDHWEPCLEDCLSILGMAPVVAAAVFRIRYADGKLIPTDTSLDMGANLAQMMGSTDSHEEFANLVRLFLTTHSDHESGNASAFTTHTVGSALSDPFYAYSAGMNALAGPLHGKANQDCLKFVIEMYEKFGAVPSEEQVKEYAWETLNSGKVIPGYGHAVLRQEDPRFTALYQFGEQHCADDPIFKTVSTMYKVVPGVLIEHGKAANPYPNVDAASGSLLHHFGVKEVAYYTVFFGVSRALGVLSQLVLNRALGTAIMRPKSVPTKWVEGQVAK